MYPLQQVSTLTVLLSTDNTNIHRGRANVPDFLWEKTMKKLDKAKCQTVNEDRTVRICVILFFMVCVVAYLVWYIIKHDMPADTFITLFKSVNSVSVMFGVMLAAILLELVRWLFYRHSVRTIMTKGTSCKGTVEDVICIPQTLGGYGRKAGGDRWEYKVRMPDGSFRMTDEYTNNFFYDLSARTCTVYEYNGRYHFTDFK